MTFNSSKSEQLQGLMREVTAKGHQLFSSESVGRGHPDKMADQISDLVVDAYMAVDPNARVAVETSCKDSLIALTGEVSHCGPAPNLVPMIRDHIASSIGFNRGELGLDGNTCAISLTLGSQSSEIAQGTREASVGDDDAQGAGDQGHMFGYACLDTPERMPLAHNAASKIVKALNQTMDDCPDLGLRPDNKCQITVEETPDGHPVRIAVVTVAQQHHPDLNRQLLEDVVREIASASVPKGRIDDNTLFLINGTGSFTLGGPHGDAGLTGRKIIVDTYGGAARHGGGAFSGKDPSKVDRSAAYMGRKLANDIVGNGHASRCEVQIGYCIGIASPVSLRVNTFGTSKGVSDLELTQIVLDRYDLRPSAIIRYLGLKSVRYLPTATYGHFGWADYPWEQVHDL